MTLLYAMTKIAEDAADIARRMRTAKQEIAGLGILATPEVVHLLHAGASAASRTEGRVGEVARVADVLLRPASNVLEHTPLGHAVELGGLGVLANPSIQELREKHASAYAELLRLRCEYRRV